MATETLIRRNYRIYPDFEQIQLLNQGMGNQRFIWNYFLAKSVERYESEKKFIFYNDMSKMLPDLKDEFEFLKLGDSQSLQQTLRQLDIALKSCFKSIKKEDRRGFPKFKKKSNVGNSCHTQSIKIINNKLKLPKIWRHI